MGWRFDLYSALIGVGFTLLLLGLGSLLREPFLRGWQEVKAAFLRIFSRITAGAEERYRERVIRWAQCMHALAEMGPLEQYFVSPHLIPPLPPPNPEREVIAAPQPLTLNDALRGHSRLLIVGGPASGRTTLLAYLALVHARKESGWTSSERIPMYIYLPAMDWTSPSDGKNVPPVQIVQAALQTVGASGIAATLLHRSLQAGAALVLADGWDELDTVAQEAATAWLANLVNSFPGNFWIVATGAQRYAPLTDIGFVPLRLQSWDRPEVLDFLTRLPVTEHFPLASATESLVRLLKKTSSLLDGALWARAILEGSWTPSTRRECYRYRLEKWTGSLPPLPSANKEETPSVTPEEILRALALKLQEEGRFVFSRQELEEFVAGMISASPSADESATPSEAGPEAPSAMEPEAKSETALNPPAKPVRSIVAALLKSLLSPGSPLVACAPDRYHFAHPLWQAWLAAEEVATRSPDVLISHLDDPHWLPVVDFYAEIGAMAPIVQAWLSQPDDLWHTRLRTAARWVALAPPGTSWRNGVMALLGRSLLDPALSGTARERLAEALIWTGDPGVPLFLRHALQNPSTEVRKIAAHMMGALGETDLSGLVKALEDPSEDVRVAAVRALGEIGAPAALDWLVHVLTSGDEVLQVEAARSLAHRGEDGHRVLKEAIKDEDFLVRRAAAYGLGEIEALWARELLEKAAREDPQWIVRSAATTALSEQERKSQPDPPHPPPVPSDMGWLIAWAAERGEGVGVGDAAFGPLLRALAEGSPPIRRMAAQTLGLVGRPEHADALRRLLNDPDPEVAVIALRALEELSARYGLSISAG